MMSEPIEFWSEMECSGVRSLACRQSLLVSMPVWEGDIDIGVPSCGLRKRTPSSVTCASFSSDTIWNLSRCQLNVDVNVGYDATHPPLSAHDSESAACLRSWSKFPLLIPVRILCGHDCNLCAPPTASRVFWPGFRPLINVSVAKIPGSNGGIQMVRIVQAQPAASLLKLLWREAFQRSLRCHGHEDWQLEWAMREVQDRRAGLCCLRDLSALIDGLADHSNALSI